ncbi:hypothetical protein Fot_38302 [Forsythia ovata]|uniref:Uncharacterized protein n=1 Tax=Forsythia ovata TaxID=205694 RepID=A0ABD1S1G7_9LAMI
MADGCRAARGGCRAARQPSPYTFSPPANINPPLLAGNNPIPPPGSAGNSPIPPPPNPILPYYPWFYLNLPGVPCIHCSAATIITQSTTWISCWMLPRLWFSRGWTRMPMGLISWVDRDGNLGEMGGVVWELEDEWSVKTDLKKSMA